MPAQRPSGDFLGAETSTSDELLNMGMTAATNATTDGSTKTQRGTSEPAVVAPVQQAAPAMPLDPFAAGGSDELFKQAGSAGVGMGGGNNFNNVNNGGQNGGAQGRAGGGGFNMGGQGQQGNGQQNGVQQGNFDAFNAFNAPSGGGNAFNGMGGFNNGNNRGGNRSNSTWN
jgi:hypothetical protein